MTKPDLPRVFDLLPRAEDLLARIDSGSTARLRVDTDDRVYFQVIDDRYDVDTGHLVEVKGGKWYLSPFMTDGEVVQKALQAFLAFAEHEIREAFTYMGKRIYGPHLALDALVEIADRVDRRE